MAMFEIYEGHSVDKSRSLEQLRAQVTVIRWHLDAAMLDDGEKKRRHLDGAALTYQGAMELLVHGELPDAERAAFTKQLSALREQLRVAGQNV